MTSPTKGRTDDVDESPKKQDAKAQPEKSPPEKSNTKEPESEGEAPGKNETEISTKTNQRNSLPGSQVTRGTANPEPHSHNPASDLKQVCNDAAQPVN